MASIIKIKRSSTPGAVPSGGALAAGELAVNLVDKVIFSSSDGSDIVRLSDSALANTNAAISNLNTNLTGTNTAIRTLVSTQTSRVDLINTNLTSTNTALRTLISDRLQVANAAATYQTIDIERAALANTNAYIATKLDTASYTASDVLTKIKTVDGSGSGLDADTLDGNDSTHFGTAADVTTQTGRIDLVNTNLTSTNTAIRGLVTTQTSRVDLINTNLTTTNTALRTLISDRIQVANVAANYQTIDIERAALANTNAYIATKPDAADPETSGLLAHTGRATISTNLAVTGNTTIGGNLVVDGNLNVEGAVTYISTSTLNADDSMIKLAANNSADTVDTGIYGKYVESATTKYTGYFRDASDGVVKFYTGLEVEPTTTVNTGGTGYTLAQIDAIIDGGTY